MYGINGFRKLVNILREFNFEFVDFFSYKKANLPSIIFRHDIDFSLNDALIIASLEEKLDIKATYFFMLTTNTYSAISLNNKKLITEIKEKGHTISLHFDPTAYQDIDKGFCLEKKLFEDIFDVEVKIVSLHRPGKFLENNNKILEGSLHTYQDEFFKEMIYLSDSAGSDIKKKLREVNLSSPKKTIQMLTHPIWWTSNFNSPTETLYKWIEEHQSFIISETQKNCKSFKL